MYQAVEIIIPLGAFALIFGIVYIGVTSHHRKEMAMIEAGMNPSKEQNSKHTKIRAALLFLLVPTGVFVGNILSQKLGLMRAQTMGLLFGFIFGGAALTAAYFIETIFEKNDEVI